VSVQVGPNAGDLVTLLDWVDGAVAANLQIMATAGDVLTLALAQNPTVVFTLNRN